MKIIQGQQIKSPVGQNVSAPKRTVFSNGYLESLKENNEWIQTKGEELLQSFMLPPLQVVAASINFCILLISGHHLFELPLKSFSDVLDSKQLFEKIMANNKPMAQVYAIKENA
jgi:hypothetical protein